ncbi:50S ribosomal protein L10 [Lyngbya confervoides]|uniref:Large ribosomal subunit protein uL10 n=1 Tax=Lyngbya confervoides BDU141951 TaxID=1574623 RepID=A0ABD4T5D3_9CYAN|nr:50S ribosomal protein L10 [Lyngbya confervoides]MCM1983575.1 50S ribosomal protein L10 [Lyngbya confervoides BDU141951]
MGRTPENKRQIVADLKQQLSDAQMAVVIDYQGLSVAEISDLRNRVRSAGAVCKVTKNTLMRLAIDGDDNWQPLTEYLKGSSAFLLVKEDLSAIKSYQEFQKATKKTAIRGAVMEGKPLSEAEVKALGDLPTKEVLMAQIAGALNAITAKVAIGVKEVPSSIARGLNAYATKEG